MYLIKSFDVIFYTFSCIIAIINQMLSKYAKYESLFSVQISQAIALALCIVGCINPLFLIFNIIYFFYLKKQAINTIKIIYAEN